MASILLSRSPSLDAKIDGRFARTARELWLALAENVPRAIVIDAEHTEAVEALRSLGPIGDRTLVIVATRDVTKEPPPGAHVVVAWESLPAVLDGVPVHEVAPAFERLFNLTILGGQLDQALERAADEIAKWLGVDRCLIASRGDSTGGAASGAHTWDSFSWNRTSERCRAASVAGATLIGATGYGGSESYLAVPLANPAGTYGFVGIVVERPIVFSPAHRTALATLATRLGSELGWRAVHQRTTDELDRLGNAPGHDLLLGMWNRMAMAELASVYVSASKRSVLPLAVAVVNIVDLQGINKRFGLGTGDRVLKRVADAVRATIRTEDVVGRWGGDKVAALLHGTPIDGAQRVAERLRVAIDARPLELPDGAMLALPVTLGIAALAPNEDAAALMARAVYAAKEARDGGQAIMRAVTGPSPRISGPIEISDDLRATVGGVYRLQHEISRGGMGVVYRAEDLALERPVAIKMLRPDLAEERAVVEQLRVEAAMLARLQHPNLVQIYSFGQTGSDSYFVMELVEGEGLQQAIERHRLEGTQVPYGDVVVIIEEIASALDALHDRGIVHRDVKPANVIRDPFRRRAVLVDVGIARRFGQFVEAAGTPGYVAPEVIGGAEATPRSDVYGLAATAYHLLALAAPWGDGDDVISLQVSGRPAPPPSSHRADLACIDALMASALSHDPKQRPGAAGQFATRLRVALPVESEAVRKTDTARRQGNLIMPRRAAAKTRGVAFRSVGRALGVRDAQKLRDSIGDAHPDLANALTDTAPLAWLPTELFCKLLQVAPVHSDRDRTRLARDIARATVRASFRRFFPSSSATLVPERTLSAIRNVWGQYQMWGIVSSMPVNSTETVVRIAEPVRDPELCAWTEGLLDQLVVLSGGRAPTVSHEACVTRGDDACLYRVVWNRQ